eukprot:2527085-Rhodomonas_salina.4
MLALWCLVLTCILAATWLGPCVGAMSDACFATSQADLCGVLLQHRRVRKLRAHEAHERRLQHRRCGGAGGCVR